MKAFASLLLIAPLLPAASNARIPADPYEYVSPRPGSEFVTTETTIILRPTTFPDQGSFTFPWITVRGSSSGRHSGRWIAAEGGATLIFRPDTPFAPGETVTVNVRGNHRDELSFQFKISPRISPPDRELIERRDGQHATVGRSVRRPSRRTASRGELALPTDFPSFTVTVNEDPEPGYLFIGPRYPDAAPINYAIMLDNAGDPAFFRTVDEIGSDFKKHAPAELYSRFRGGTAGEFELFNDSFEILDSFRPENGYAIIDGHDFQILPNGNVLIGVQDWQVIDMSEIVPGGNPNAWVVGFVLQEQDPSHNVVFQWRSWDHFEITDALGIDFTAPWIDYVHFNAFEYDDDGNIMFSSREMCEITKIDRTTGDILWRLGGSNNEFTLVDDTRWFERQHSVRRTPTGTVTIFDNGALEAPWVSRAVEYDLDEIGKVATLVWQYEHDPPWFAGWGSNVQRLPGGHTVIDWAPLGIVTEVRSDGTKAFELQIDEQWTYRAFRFEWDGVAARPELWNEVSLSEATLHFTKFGDPDVALFHIYAGNVPEPTTEVGSTPGDSFVLGLDWPDILYVRVTAEDSAGNESAYSNERQIVPPVPLGTTLATPSGSRIELHQNRPNPFGPRTTIPFALPERGDVELSVHDVSGRLVRVLVRGVMAQGSNHVVWDGMDARGHRAGPGVYFCRLRAGDEELTRRLTLIR